MAVLLLDTDYPENLALGFWKRVDVSLALDSLMNRMVALISLEWWHAVLFPCAANCTSVTFVLAYANPMPSVLVLSV